MQAELQVWFSLWNLDQFSFISMAPMCCSTTRSSKMYFKHNKDTYNCMVHRLEIYCREFCWNYFSDHDSIWNTCCSEVSFQIFLKYCFMDTFEVCQCWVMLLKSITNFVNLIGIYLYIIISDIFLSHIIDNILIWTKLSIGLQFGSERANIWSFCQKRLLHCLLALL